jgi:Protein kinase domain.
MNILDEWDTISPEAKDIISKMLKYKPSDRPSAHELLLHNWFLKANKENHINYNKLKCYADFHVNSSE